MRESKNYFTSLSKRKGRGGGENIFSHVPSLINPNSTGVFSQAFALVGEEN